MKIAVYGASGYTGRLVATEVNRRDMAVVMVGRNEARLREAAARLGLSAAVLRPAPLDDPEALRAAFADCDVVINCAGPFTLFGEPVVDAAIQAGCHYVDTSGEQAHIKHVFDAFSDAARDANVTVVPATGFDILPGDFIANLTCPLVAPVERLVIAYSATEWTMTRGTMRSALQTFAGNDLHVADGQLRHTGWGTHRGSLRFPGQRKSSPMIKFPSGEIASVPQHVTVKNLDVVMDACALVPIRPVASLTTRVGPVTALMLRTPVKSLLGTIVNKLPEGPDDDQRRTATWTVMALAYGADGQQAHGVIRGTDIYGSTATMCVEAARRLVTDDAPAGVLAPAQAFAPTDFLGFLAAHGVEWSVQNGPVD